MDKILLKNIEVFGYHGVYEEERLKGQNFYIDVELKLDLNKACESDELEDTVDYSEVYYIIVEINKLNKFKLLEKFADTISQKVLSQYKQVKEICVSIKKSEVPFTQKIDYVEIKVKRGRDE